MKIGSTSQLIYPAFSVARQSRRATRLGL